MTKTDLIKTLAVNKGIPLNVAARIVNEIFDGLATELIVDGRIEIRGFGSFVNREYGEYAVRNPKTGASSKIGKKKRPYFKVGVEMRQRIK